MRQIKPGPEPAEFTAWKQETPGMNFGKNADRHIKEDVLKPALLRDQGWLCAYTGLRIESETSHVEHLLPQSQGSKGAGGDDLAYRNMVACYPGAGGEQNIPFGARKKDKWPAVDEQYLFVSPHSDGCESRFRFDLGGTISVANPNDLAAQTTIRKLALDHRLLTLSRKEAISGTLGRGPSAIDITAARNKLRKLQQQEEEAGCRLDAFCFALKQALEQHIRRLMTIRDASPQS